jgi:uncharacterized membrane protein YgaE (UPF0421/DUF939 family)
MYSEELQMKPNSKKGFIYNQNFVLRLVYISLLFLAAILVSKLILPIEIATINLFLSSILGTLVGTYLASVIIKSSEVIEEQTDNLEDLVDETITKGKEILEDLKTKNSKVEEDSTEEVKQEPETPKKTARERLKDKGLM